MISNLDPSSEIFLADLLRGQRRVERAQREVTSGLRIQKPSDAPDEIDSLLQIRAARERNSQIQSNLAGAKTEADTAEKALATAANLIDRALVLTSQALGAFQTAENRKSIADEVESLTEQIVASTGTAVDGRYIFSGDRDREATYQVDWTEATGVMQLVPVSATRRIEDPAGGSFAASRTAAEIFDARNADGTPASGNVFAALAGLRTALLNDDENALSVSLGLVRESSGHLNTQIAFYGSLQRRIQDATDFAAGYDTRLQAELGTKEDADIVAAALELSQANTQIQAALSARAKLPRTSLFDFIG